MNLVDQVEAKEMKKEVADVHIGDTVKVHMRIVEGEKERIQVIEGVVIKMRGGGARKTLTVRKISFGIGVERIFPIHSPRVEKIDIVKRAKIRQAKLYYLRELRGKAARLKELKPIRPTTKAKRKPKRGKKAKAAKASS
ncbi:MAG: 50S ribosomal protein L19 [Nitrospinales bacterium]|jgi:large subunit ribosomal protein L19|nr:50S ribosomal protein L19 [Nitrospinaceae bacterium]MDG1929276.1 50S ribosomal protein L19 [Nitrospinaceae bacterium]|tara:strand:+ start:105 stop:521 length:417 start_codon:yes stop_codon:yes gene_type:complete